MRHAIDELCAGYEGFQSSQSKAKSALIESGKDNIVNNIRDLFDLRWSTKRTIALSRRTASKTNLQLQLLSDSINVGFVNVEFTAIIKTTNISMETPITPDRTDIPKDNSMFW